jgi:hypothetical protein
VLPASWTDDEFKVAAGMHRNEKRRKSKTMSAANFVSDLVASEIAAHVYY